MSSSNQRPPQINESFLPGFGISSHIIFSHIGYMLGPYAGVRRYKLHGREGYLVSAPGPSLTRSQIDDLRAMSNQYELQAAERMFQSSRSSGDLYINLPFPIDGRRR